MSQDSQGYTALYKASAHNDIDNVAKIISTAASTESLKKLINLPSYTEKTPVYIASQNGHAEVVKILVQANANVNLCDIYGTSSLHISSKKGNSSVVKHLLNGNADVNKRNKSYIKCTLMILNY